MTKHSLFTIAYASESMIAAADLESEISKIVDVAQSHNEANDITGVLLFMNNRFLQILEGEQDTLYTLMQNIEKDTRHKDVTYLSEKNIKMRGFPDWSMDFYKLKDKKKISLQNLSKIRTGLSRNALSSGRDILTFYNSLLK